MSSVNQVLLLGRVKQEPYVPIGEQKWRFVVEAKHDFKQLVADEFVVEIHNAQLRHHLHKGSTVFVEGYLAHAIDGKLIIVARKIQILHTDKRRSQHNMKVHT